MTADGPRVEGLIVETSSRLPDAAAMRWHGRRVTVYAYAQPVDIRSHALVATSLVPVTWRTEGPAATADAAAPADDADVPRDARGNPRSPWQELPPLQAPPGVTSLAGQVLRLNGRPLANVSLDVDGVETRTDNGGRFLLALDHLDTRSTSSC